ncbi:MAG: tRNA pseudouridine(38-40) synthase TruA [Chloroflexota bacterium]|nr:tRNA pseudouridine(38-40) synthase TruA [Chloroflexota bacterium]
MRAIVAYDGTRYGGSQVQANAPTVQAELERALGTILRHDVRVVLAGRTDAGVHATGQVMSFRSDQELDREAIRRGVNALLPADIAIRDVDVAGEDFHARYSATGRTYEYRIRNAPQREPLERHREHWVPQAIDVDAMERATGMLVGCHDLAAFAIGRSGERTIRRAEWHREGTLLRFEIEANGFLRGAVRGIVGTLLWVGRGHITVERFGEILRGRDRSAAGPSAPALGLCLIHVAYDKDRSRPAEGE